ncbi:unnamed protein product [Leptosia nina]|uniref:AB hydrolase-1 domain-containing protein n=1 Tax=Leptosia nina TaxID=320188 RepID=A0AAV1JJI4_9NEOP
MQLLLVCVPLYMIAAFFLGASITAGIFVLHVAVAPLIFKYSKTVQRNMIFANFAQWPCHNYEDPVSCGIEGALNITINYNSKVDNCPIQLGIWHILAKSSYDKIKGSFGSSDNNELRKQFENELTNSKHPIILYCHGNSNSRAASHRILLYKFFQKMDFHTIAFDYRGYGDSTSIIPTERGVVEDSLNVYDWINNAITNSKDRPPIFIWGHSLGTGISSHLVGNLPELSQTVLDRQQPLPQANGLILEAPFSNLADAVTHHPLTSLVRWLPYFDNTFVSPFKSNEDYCFKSDTHLAKVKDLPVMILHAKDDVIIPHVVGVKLYNSILESRDNDSSKLKLHSYETQASLGHKFICNAEDLPQVVGDFISNHR